jgi:hypothetical protein
VVGTWELVRSGVRRLAIDTLKKNCTGVRCGDPEGEDPTTQHSTAQPRPINRLYAAICESLGLFTSEHSPPPFNFNDEYTGKTVPSETSRSGWCELRIRH